MLHSNSPITVLITSAGVATASNVIDALRRETSLPTRIVAVDMNPYAAGLYRADVKRRVPPCSDPGYLDALLDICRQEEVFFFLPLYSGEISLASRNVQRFSEIGVKTMLASEQASGLCDDKPRFLAFLKEHNFPFPPTYDLGGCQQHVFPMFIKPASGSSSKNAYRLDAQADLDYFSAKYPRAILQDYIEGVEYTVDCLVDRGELLACVPRSRLVVKDGKSMVGKTVDHPRLREAVGELLRAVGMHGPCNVQVIEDRAGRLFFIEINPRLAAGGLPLAVRAGANIPAMMLRLALGQNVAPVTDYQRDLIMIRYLDNLFLEEGPDGLHRI
ncbi:ATP-grasp domain-containing protein [Solidesulfovibrio sp. C21]|uniref:ATP-grasp domain-containing protein n=1 Tax=Solidesulfovibrio sp. C21 TaxID=3398613 RepID=UPI0039FD93FC